MFGWLSLGALNHLLSQADWARTKLAPFSGKHARFVMPPWQLDFAIRDDGTFEAAAAVEADVTMTLPADAPIRALQGQDKVLEAALVEGNAQLATELSFVLRNLRWDAEEDLSRVVGDIAARRIAQGAADFASWQQDSSRRLAENLAEFVTEESSLLVRKPDIAEFSSAVSQLREQISLLDRRIEKLVA